MPRPELIAGPSDVEHLLGDQQVGERAAEVFLLGLLGRDRLRRDRLDVVVERHRGRADVGAFLGVDLGPRPAGVGQRVQVVVGRRGVGVRDDLLVLELAEELGERPERQPELLGDPPARGDADVQQELEDQALDLREVQARLLEVGDGLRAEGCLRGGGRLRDRA